MQFRKSGIEERVHIRIRLFHRGKAGFDALLVSGNGIVQGVNRGFQIGLYLIDLGGQVGFRLRKQIFEFRDLICKFLFRGVGAVQRGKQILRGLHFIAERFQLGSKACVGGFQVGYGACKRSVYAADFVYLFLQRFSVQRPDGVKSQSAVRHCDGIFCKADVLRIGEVRRAAGAVTPAREKIAFAHGNGCGERNRFARKILGIVHGGVASAVGAIYNGEFPVGGEYRVQVHFVVVDFGERFGNRLFVRIRGGLPRRQGRPAGEMIAFGRGDAERSCGKEVERLPVDCGLSARFGLSVYVDHGIGNGDPARIQGQFVDVFIPYTGICDVERRVKNQFARPVSFRAVAGEEIAGSYGRNHAVGGQPFSVSDGDGGVVFRPVLGQEGDHGHGALPDRVQRDVSAVCSAEVEDFRAVAVYGFSVFRKRPADEGMPDFSESVERKRAFRTETEGVLRHAAFSAAATVTDRIGVCLPYGVQNDVFACKSKRLIGGIFRCICAGVFRPPEEGIARSLRKCGGYSRRIVCAVRSIVRRGVRAAVCGINEGEFGTVRHQNAAFALHGKRIFAVFRRRQPLSVDVNFGAVAGDRKRCGLVEIVGFVQARDGVAGVYGKGDAVLRLFPYRV